MDKQQRGIRNTIIVVVIFMVAVVCGFIWRMGQPVIMSKEELLVNGAVLLSTPRRFSDFDLVDHNGDAFSLKNLNDQWSILFFAFTNCPDICPTTLSTLSNMYSKLDAEEQKNLRVIMVSLDVERDTVDKLAGYVPYFHDEFVGVTGNRHFVRRLTAELNIAYSRVDIGADNYTIDHSTQLLLINPNGHYHAFFKAPHSEVALRQTWRSMKALF